MTTSRISNIHANIAFDFLACSFGVVFHFTNYIIHVGYTRVWPDLALVYSGLFGLALCATVILRIPSVSIRMLVFSFILIVTFSDAVLQFGTQGEGLWLGIVMVVFGTTLILLFVLRRNINKIIFVVFLTMLVSTVWPAAFTSKANETHPAIGTEGKHDALPVVVHIILDEHIGFAGITDDLPGAKRIRALLVDFYIKNGFRLYPRAFSQSVETRNSLGALFNGADVADAPTFVERSRDKYVMTHNAYLDMWESRGYGLRILQSSYLNFCSNSDVGVKHCATYLHDGYDARSTSGMPALDRVSLIAQMYASSLSLVKLARLGGPVVGNHLEILGKGRRDSDFLIDRVGPLAVMTPLDDLIDKISLEHAGTMYFAHLLMPHYPYVYDGACQVRIPVSSWQMRSDDNWKNTVESRRERYGQYFQQIECTVSKLQRLFDLMKQRGIYGKATIIIHGDHGSRITRFKPEAGSAERMELADFLDGYSTLFACKAPGMAAGFDTGMMSLASILTHCTGTPGPGAAVPTSKLPSVCLLDNLGKCLKVTLPIFPYKGE